MVVTICTTAKKIRMIARNGSRKRSGSDSQFPGRLHDLMEYVEENKIEHVISWVLKGRGFVVHDPDRLVELLPLFFSQTKYRSFRRQLNMWHFERIEKGPSKGAFIHPYFVRGNRELCHSMSRHVSLKPQRGSSIGSHGSSSCSTQSEERSSKIEGDNPETLRRGRYSSCSSSDTAAPLGQQHYPLEPVPSMNIPSFLPSSSDVTFASTERNATFDTPYSDSFTSTDIDLPLIEPDPIRALVVDSAAQKNATKSISTFSKVPSYHLLEPSMTVATFLNDALCTQPITTAICWDDDLDFLSHADQDDRVMVNNCYGHDDNKVLPSFIMPRHLKHQGSKTLSAEPVPSSEQKLASSSVRQVTETFDDCPPCVAPQFFEHGLSCEDVQFVDFGFHERR